MDERQQRLCLMMLLTLLALASLAAAEQGAPRSLFADKRALEVGDVVTILLMEYTQGSNSASTDGETRHNFQFDNSSSGLMDFIPGFGLATSAPGARRRGRGRCAASCRRRLWRYCPAATSR